ncbi:MAG TPA: serine/threonine protein kinase, partial [Aggregatilineales bacterium]|nr:serine/threonine protein kinase [Aggregatilineales bacterium]
MDENLIGKIINGSYELTGVIARGGMATVYKAHQISMNRDVAIKILPREFLHEPAFRERFKQEAAIAARLEHRAIVPVYDYGEWEGVPYIAMR